MIYGYMMNKILGRSTIKKIADQMVCILCNKMFQDPTTISECLHTFCRKCITDKLTRERTRQCPQCNVDLGAKPLEKLKTDNSLNDLRKGLFDDDSYRVMSVRNEEEHIGSSNLMLPSKRGVPQRAGRQSIQSSKKTKKLPEGGTRRAEKNYVVSKGRSLCIKEPNPNLEAVEEPAGNVSVTELPPKRKRGRPRKFLVGESSGAAANKDLVQEAGERLTQSKDPVEVVSDLTKAKGKGIATEPEGGPSIPVQPEPEPEPVEEMSVYKRRPKKAPAAPEVPNRNIRPQAVVDALARTQPGLKIIWFYLIAATNRERGSRLPQINPYYFSMTNVDAPVSIIHKLLRMKLNLDNNFEIELTMQDEEVAPTMKMRSMIDMWVDMQPKKRMNVKTGSSAKKFVAVLHYGGRA